MLVQDHVYIIGDVISVGMRAWVKVQSKLLNVTGWVRNAHDRPEIFGASGGVEAVLQGEEQSVDKLLELLKKGPALARIEDVEIIPQPVKEVFSDFSIKA